jgi:DNA-directed RNA polymerase specialized sigma24 family protein
MKEENLLELIEAEVSRYMRKYGCPNLYEKNDLISEGYLIVTEAIKKFDENKKTSMKTYLQTCLKNRLINISLYEKRRICEPLIQEDCSYEPKSQNFFPYIDLCLSFSKIDSHLFDELLAGELRSVNALKKIKGGKKCFAHIMRLSRLNEMNLA